MRTIKVTEVFSLHSPAKIYYGKFHCFTVGLAYQEHDGTWFQQAIALVELEDGSILETVATNIEFIGDYK